MNAPCVRTAALSLALLSNLAAAVPPSAADGGTPLSWRATVTLKSTTHSEADKKTTRSAESWWQRWDVELDASGAPALVLRTLRDGDDAGVTLAGARGAAPGVTVHSELVADGGWTWPVEPPAFPSESPRVAVKRRVKHALGAATEFSLRDSVHDEAASCGGLATETNDALSGTVTVLDARGLVVSASLELTHAEKSRRHFVDEAEDGGRLVFDSRRSDKTETRWRLDLAAP